MDHHPQLLSSCFSRFFKGFLALFVMPTAHQIAQKTLNSALKTLLIKDFWVIKVSCKLTKVFDKWP